MAKRFYCTFLLLFPFYLIGQNLIPNPSFENVKKVSTNYYEPIVWQSPTLGSPDYYNSINGWGVPSNRNGYQEAKEGVAYLGLSVLTWSSNFSINFREYIQSKLTNVLKEDSIYCFQIHVSLSLIHI